VPIVVTHTPTTLINLPQSIQLAMAGHTHCGQVVLPVIGRPKLPFRSGSRQACGVIRDGQRTNIITAGLGVSNLPFRLGAPPDFWVITVVPSKAE
jgi:predicted MPP superfamily phosphohydrolase